MIMNGHRPILLALSFEGFALSSEGQPSTSSEIPTQSEPSAISLNSAFATLPRNRRLSKHPLRMRVLPAPFLTGSKRSESTDHSSSLSPVFATHPRICALTPLFATLPKIGFRKSFVCHTCTPLPRLSPSFLLHATFNLQTSQPATFKRSFLATRLLSQPSNLQTFRPSNVLGHSPLPLFAPFLRPTYTLLALLA